MMLRDYERHIEQLARSLETGEDRFVTQYGEWLVPVYRHRQHPDAGLRDHARRPRQRLRQPCCRPTTVAAFVP